MGDTNNDDLRVSFDSRLTLKFMGSQITTDAALLAYRELDETLGLTETAGDLTGDSRLGSNKQLILDLDSSVSEIDRTQEGTAHDGQTSEPGEVCRYNQIGIPGRK